MSAFKLIRGGAWGQPESKQTPPSVERKRRIFRKQMEVTRLINRQIEPVISLINGHNHTDLDFIRKMRDEILDENSFEQLMDKILDSKKENWTSEAALFEAYIHAFWYRLANP